MTTVLRTVAELRTALAGRDVALVPTMGALHDGHLSLVTLARAHAAEVVVSIFVNPMQFAAGDDFDRYPRTLEDDVHALEAAGVEWVFAPDAAELYPGPGHATVATVVQAGPAGARWEGAARPGHFDGMLTVVLKLMNAVQPRVAVFGEKDAQQLALVTGMVADLNVPVRIVAAPIVREADGLARSSRNVYLTGEQRAAAPAIHAALQHAAADLAAGVPVDEALGRARSLIAARPELEIDYLELVDGRSFLPLGEVGPEALLIAAVRAGRTRLLDAERLG